MSKASLTSVCTLLVLVSMGSYHINAQNVPIDNQSAVDSSLNVNKKTKLVSTGDRIQINPSQPLMDSLALEIVKIDSATKQKAPTQIDSLNFRIANSEIKSTVEYKASDSIVYDLETEEIFLYNQSNIKYKDFDVTAERIHFEWESTTLNAEAGLDSNGNVKGKPQFKQGQQSYDAAKMSYNFSSQKGKIYSVITEEGGGYLHAEEVKKNEYDEWYGKSVKYTTCSHEDPHFYIEAKRAKTVPNKVIVTGPANLVVGDIPTPLFAPFGMFPLEKGGRSGIVLPKYDFATARGGTIGFFVLRDGGYYWDASDKINFTFLSEITTGGSWGLSLGSRYKVRYKYHGNFYASYFRRAPFDPDDPQQAHQNVYELRWRFNQDSKAIPWGRFSADVEARTANGPQQRFEYDQRLLTATLNSGISFVPKFRGSRFSMTFRGRHNQNIRDRTMTITLPDVTVVVRKIYFFKPKISSGNKKWFESIGADYNFRSISLISGTDSILFHQPIIENLRTGAQHSLRFDAPQTLFKYLELNPSVNFNNQHHLKRIDKSWNSDTLISQTAIDSFGEAIYDTLFGQLMTDTSLGFYNTGNVNASLQLSTRLYGTYQFKSSKKIQALRHEISPRVDYSYAPPISGQFFNPTDSVQNNADGTVETYNHYNGFNTSSASARNELSKVNFNVGNVFQLKVKSNDTIETSKKINLLNQFSLRTGYNFIKDSLQWDNLSMNANTDLPLNINLRMDAQYSPYAVSENNRRINRFQAKQESGGIMRFVNAGFTVGTNFRSKKKEKKQTNQELVETQSSEEEQEAVAAILENQNQYYDFNQPWTIELNYNFRISKGTSANPDTVIVRANTIRLNTNFNLTPKWKFDLRTGFDIRDMDLVLTTLSVVRDLHCWELRFNVTPYPLNRMSYGIQLAAKSTVLQDLKLSRKGNDGSTSNF